MYLNVSPFQRPLDIKTVYKNDMEEVACSCGIVYSVSLCVCVCGIFSTEVPVGRCSMVITMGSSRELPLALLTNSSCHP